IEAMLDLSTLTREMTTVPEIYILFGSDDRDAIDAFFEVTQTRFPFTSISTDEMFSLIGESTPRFYWLRDGTIVAHWDEDIAQKIEENFMHRSGS
ncbi:MAG: hypothetical protein R3245_13180, partial [Kiloniellales bacterium]|nr:hypothetical protein [Kiloniellales bacterium]